MKAKMLATVLGFAVIALAAPARAEVVTMVCGNFTLDIDLSRSTVFYVEQQVTVSAQVTDRFIEWTNPWFPTAYRHRIDRTTGIFYNWAKGSGWFNTGTTCRRAGKPVL